MAEVILPTAYQKQVWINDYLQEYIRASGYDRYMGRSSTAIFRVLSEAQTEGGKTVNIPLVGRLIGAGVSGSTVLEGNEEDLSLYMDQVRTDWRRNAVKVPKSSQYQSEIDLLDAAKPQLRQWAATVVLRAGITDQLGGIVIPGGAAAVGVNPDTVIRYADATAGQRNTHLVNNSDRMLFGIDIANATSGVFATALGNIDGTNDKLSVAMLSKLRRIAQATSNIGAGNPAITPYMTDNGEEWYTFFTGPRGMRDLRQDATMTQANREAMERGKDNPLFRAGDLLWEGIVIREIQEIGVIAGAGASGIDVEPGYLCGQSAVAIAYGQQPDLITTRDQDYKFRPAVAVEELIGIKKASFAGKQYGVVTNYHAAAADA